MLPSSSWRTSEPPPRPTDTRSGMRKFVRTSPISTATMLSRGKPCASTPTSVVVPPMSTTTASFSCVKNDAPRMEFVGPHAMVKMG